MFRAFPMMLRVPMIDTLRGLDPVIRALLDRREPPVAARDVGPR
ncbi:MAG TPA: hypothetical protein VFH82_10000 [Gemmatimonadota bacterium]|nr:hypothetical protein [Gemmatimonadota bacterium]